MKLDPNETSLMLYGFRAKDRVTEHDLGGLASMTKLTKLTLIKQNLTRVPPLPPSLEQLALSNLPGLVDISALADCPRLRHVSLSAVPGLDLGRAFTLLARCPALTELDLGELHDLPAQITKLTSVTTLMINDCFAIPDAAFARLGKLPALRALTWIDRRKTASYPDVFAALKQVTSLKFLFRKKAVPPSVTKMRSLEVLDLEHNPITALPEHIGALTKLRRLIMLDARFTKLPDSLRKCTQLEVLYGSRKLTAIPPWIDELQQLTTLELRGSKLTSLPAQLGNLRQLRELYVPETITEVPPGLTLFEFNGPRDQVTMLPLPPPTSSRVVLDDATRIPADLGQPTALVVSVDVPLPQLARLTQLESLSVDGVNLEPLVPFAAKLPALKKLYARQTIVPRAIEQLVRIEEMMLFDVEQLPPLAALDNLQRLDLSGTLRDADALDGLPALEELHLRSAQLASFTPHLPALTQLELGDLRALTRLTQLHSPELTSLSLHMTGGGRIDLAQLAQPSLRSLTLLSVIEPDLAWLPDELTTLDLRTCKFVNNALPRRISELTQLTSLTLDYVTLAKAPDLSGCTQLTRVKLPFTNYKACLPPGRWRKEGASYVR